MKIIKICGRRAAGKTHKAFELALKNEGKNIVYICANTYHLKAIVPVYKSLTPHVMFMTYEDIILLLLKQRTLYAFKNSVVIYELSESDEMLKNHDILLNFFNNEGVSEMIFTEKTDGPLEWKIIEN